MFQHCNCFPVVISHGNGTVRIPGTLLINRYANFPYDKGEVCTNVPLDYTGTYYLEYSSKADAEIHNMVIVAKKDSTHDHCHRYIVKLF